jgi:hypothetical protein
LKTTELLFYALCLDISQCLYPCPKGHTCGYKCMKEKKLRSDRTILILEGII